MREEPKHLKRGLKDISPLFQSPLQKKRTPEPVLHQTAPQFLSILSPESPRDSALLNAALAAKMRTLAFDCALISVGKKERYENGAAKQFSLSLSQFEEICHSKVRAANNFGSSLFFFNFDYSNPILFEKVLPLLDKWILIIKPDQESLAESYKFIKASKPLNLGMEYYIVINSLSEQASSRLFEGFSEIVSRRLGIGLQWLGGGDMRFPSALDSLAWEGLLGASASDTIEKRAFAGFVYPSPQAG